MDMEQKFYLLATLIEMQDCVSDGHALYRSLDDAMEAFEKEIAVPLVEVLLAFGNLLFKCLHRIVQ